MQKADALPMTPADRRQLEVWARSKTIPARVVERSRILLLLADGAGIRPTAEQLQVGYNTVRRWRDRFLEVGCQGIEQDVQGHGSEHLRGVEDLEGQWAQAAPGPNLQAEQRSSILREGGGR